MTVCIAAFAEREKAIVMLSDKAVTYPGGLQYDAGVSKFIRIGDSSWHALIAGNPTFALRVVNLAAKQLTGKPFQDSVYGMMECACECYREMRDKEVDDVILRPSLLTRDLLVSRSKDLLPLQDDLVIATHENAQKHAVGTSLLICGFDSDGNPHIFSVTDPGISNNFDLTGFHAVGKGALTAISRMLQLEAVPEDPLPLALYQVFDAKVNAEMITGVGYDCDASILVRGKKKTIQVPTGIIRLIDRIFMSHPNTPFKSESRSKAPTRWERKLESFAKRVMTPKKPRRRDKRG